MTAALNSDFFQNLLDSFKNPVLVADTDHIVLYANRAAEKFYPDGAKLLGRSLLDCHNLQSQQQMIEILQKMEQGLDEELINGHEAACSADWWPV